MQGDILIENGFIKDVGQIDLKDFDGITLNLKGKIVTPGLVCAHNHFYSCLARGMTAKIENTPDFVSILEQVWWKLDRAIDEEILYYLGIIGSLEAVKSGTTAVIDHHSSPGCIKDSLKTLAKGFEFAGLRGILCYEVTDRNGENGMIEGVEENLSFASYLKDIKTKNPDYVIECAIGAHASFTLSDRAMSLLSTAVDKSGKGIHIHVAEDKYDVSYSVNNFGRNPVERLIDFDLLNEKSILAHCVYLNSNDFNNILKKNGFVIHNPRSNMNNKVGYLQKVRDFNNVALGTDGIGSAMLEELKAAYYIAKENKNDLDFFKVCNLLHNGNEILSRYFNKNFGKIEKGFVADLTVFDYCSPTPINENNVNAHFIFGLSEKDVCSVIVNGKIILKERHFPFKVEQLYQSARKAAQKLWNRMDLL
jgi:putative selenium metabolism protein SsnA